MVDVLALGIDDAFTLGSSVVFYMQISYEQQYKPQERAEAFRLYEEKTDLGERLGIPIENYPQLEDIDGKVYGYDIDGNLKRMVEWAEESYNQACRDIGFLGPNSVELLRRRHEWDEAVAVEALEPEQSLVVLSPIPDAVMRGETSLHGYRKDLARTFVRVFYRHENGMKSLTLSLEQSDKTALQAVGTYLGMSLPESMQSEAVLSARHVMIMNDADFSVIAECIRDVYDEALYAKTGATYYQGNRLKDRQDAMSFINQQNDLIAQHMELIRQNPDSAETLRRRTAAALDARLKGQAIDFVTDRSVDVMLETGNYSGECATNTTSSTEQLGLSQGKHVTNCPLCGTKSVTATVEGETITCSDCRGSVNICTGKVTKGIEKCTPNTAVFTRRRRQPRKLTKTEQLYATYGKEGVGLRSRSVIGGAVVEVYEKQSGRIIAVV